MGADGGIDFMRLKKNADKDKVFSMLHPLNIVNHNFRDEDHRWMDENPWLFKEPYIYSRYGTDLDDQGLWVLKDILTEDCNHDMTFAELVEDMATRPEWAMFKAFSDYDNTLEKVVLTSCDFLLAYYYNRYRFDYKNFTKDSNKEAERLKLRSDNLGSLASINIKEWYDLMHSSLDVKTYSSVETWT